MTSFKKIGVLGATPCDASMGVEAFHPYGLEGLGVSISDTPEEATALQVCSPRKLQQMVVETIQRLHRNSPVEAVCLYCNSLSTAIHPSEVASETGLSVFTHLDAYRRYAALYGRIGLMAANCQSLAGIEKVLLEKNQAARVIGAAMLEIVVAIEQKLPPDTIVSSLRLPQLLSFFEAGKADVIILGCTHFPFLASSLQQHTTLPLLDPTEEMARLIKQQGNNGRTMGEQ